MWKNVDKWLDEKIEDERIETRYSKNEDMIYKETKKPMEDYNKYYKEGDSDERASDKVRIDLIKTLEMCDELREDEEMSYIESVMERYMDELGNEKNILIPPNTYRYHANYIFKKMIETCEEEGYIYEDIGPEGYMQLIDVNFKKDFYEFCYNNTCKRSSIRY